MISNRNLEDRIAYYFADVLPPRAPDRVLAGAIATIELTHQRRVPSRLEWRFQRMSNLAKLAAAALGVVAVVVLGGAFYTSNQGIGTQATPPSPRTAPPRTPESELTAGPTSKISGSPLTERFSSTVHGISLGYPSGWRSEPATRSWMREVPGQDAPETIWNIAADDQFIGLASQPLAGRSASAWISEIMGRSEWETSCGHGDTQQVTVDGASGILVFCPGRPLHALIADESRGYFIILVGSNDRRFFDDILASVRLDPGSAIDLAAPSVLSWWWSNARVYRGRIGERFGFVCPPDGLATAAGVYGTNTYSDDSAVCVAAVHAGLITFEGGGPITIEIRPGQDSYVGSTRNGVTSGEWGIWAGSFAFVP